MKSCFKFRNAQGKFCQRQPDSQMPNKFKLPNFAKYIKVYISIIPYQNVYLVVMPPEVFPMFTIFMTEAFSTKSLCDFPSSNFSIISAMTKSGYEYAFDISRICEYFKHFNAIETFLQRAIFLKLSSSILDVFVA